MATLALPLLGAIAGGQKEQTDQMGNQTQASTVSLQDFNKLNTGASALENAGYNSTLGTFNNLGDMINAGPGMNEVQSNLGYQNTFANQLQSMLSSVNNPTQASIAANANIAKSLFAPQQTALTQQFTDQGIAANRLAARLGRAGNDPIMQNELMKEQTRQQTVLNSQIGSYAQQLPDIQAGRLLNLGGAVSNLRAGLATQALQNRQTLMGLGQQLTQQERNYRLATATRSGIGASSDVGLSGGGQRGAILGGMAGAGAAAKIVGSVMGMAGGGGGGAGNPPGTSSPY